MADFTGEDFTAVIPALAEGVISTLMGDTFAFSSSSGVATITYFLMRGIDGGIPVYWYATIIDAAAVEYPGVGPVTVIRLIKRKQ